MRSRDKTNDHDNLFTKFKAILIHHHTIGKMLSSDPNDPPINSERKKCIDSSSKIVADLLKHEIIDYSNSVNSQDWIEINKGLVLRFNRLQKGLFEQAGLAKDTLYNDLNLFFDDTRNDLIKAMKERFTKYPEEFRNEKKPSIAPETRGSDAFSSQTSTPKARHDR